MRLTKRYSPKSQNPERVTSQVVAETTTGMRGKCTGTEHVNSSFHCIGVSKTAVLLFRDIILLQNNYKMDPGCSLIIFAQQLCGGIFSIKYTVTSLSHIFLRPTAISLHPPGFQWYARRGCGDALTFWGVGVGGKVGIAKRQFKITTLIQSVRQRLPVFRGLTTNNPILPHPISVSPFTSLKRYVFCPFCLVIACLNHLASAFLLLIGFCSFFRNNSVRSVFQ